MNRKGAIVERVEHAKTKRVGNLRLDKRSMTFFARLPDTEEKGTASFESKDGREVRDWLMKQLAQTEEDSLLEWVPVVRIEARYVHNKDHRYSGANKETRSIETEVEFTRFYLALTKDKTEWLKLEWNAVEADSSTALTPEDRVASAKHFDHGPKYKFQYSSDKPFTLPSADSDSHYVAFTPELWAGLLEVEATLVRSAKAMEALITTKKGLAHLAEVGSGAKQLTAGGGT